MSVGDIAVYGVDVAEGVDKNLEIGEGARVAGLEVSIVTSSVKIKDSDRTEDAGSIFATATVVDIDVRSDVLAVPK